MHGRGGDQPITALGDVVEPLGLAALGALKDGASAFEQVTASGQGPQSVLPRSATNR